MAALAGDLSRMIMGHSEATKAFRPWWDSMEDGLMYFFVVMALVTLPMTFLSTTPLECAFHPKYWPTENNTVGNIPKHARFIMGYTKKYCTETYLSPFLLYLPFTLLLVPLVLTAIEKIFIALYQDEGRMDTLYKLLVQESKDTEDVAKLEKDNVKDLHEIKQAFRKTSHSYKSYLYRTMAELVAVLLLTVFYSDFFDIVGISTPLFQCDVHGLLYLCIVPNQRFFSVVYYLSLISIIGYTFCTTYNLIWILNPRLNSLSRLLGGCKRRKSINVDDVVIINRMIRNKKALEGPEIKLDMYFDKTAKDFNLLMNLLAESSGIVQSLRILSMMDKQFQNVWYPQDVHIIHNYSHFGQFDLPTKHGDKDENAVHDNNDENKKGDGLEASVLVVWNDCPIAGYVNSVSQEIFEYTVEISPETEIPVKSFVYYRDICLSLDTTYRDLEDNITLPFTKEGPNIVKLSDGPVNLYKYAARFDGLSLETEYTVYISTELGGKTITQHEETFKPDATSTS